MGYVLAVGAPGLFHGRGAVILTTMVGRQSPSKSNGIDFVIASYSVVQGPAPRAGQGLLVQGRVWTPGPNTYKNTMTSQAGPELNRQDFSWPNEPDYPDWGDSLVRGFGSQIVIHGHERHAESIAADVVKQHDGVTEVGWDSSANGPQESLEE